MFENKNFFGFTLLLIGFELAGCTLNTACLKDFAAPGRGREALDKWSYNPDTKQCESFIFRGRNPSKNQFDDEKTCMSVCVLDACPEGYALTDVDIPGVGPGEEKSDIISVGCTRTNSSQVDVRVNGAGEGRSGYSCDQNEWDGKQWCHCKPGKRISVFASKHDNGNEDRQWSLQCGEIQPEVEAKQTDWDGSYYSGYNWWDSIFHWVGINTNAYMVGMHSYHSNSREDRRFEVMYRRSKNWVLTGCSGWISLNGYDRDVKHVLGEKQVIVELWSRHSNRHEDRKFWIKVCDLVPKICDQLEFIIYDYNKITGTENNGVWLGDGELDNRRAASSNSYTATILYSEQTRNADSYTFSRTFGWSNTASLSVRAGYNWGVITAGVHLSATAGFSHSWSTSSTWQRSQTKTYIESHSNTLSFTFNCKPGCYCKSTITATQGKISVPYTMISKSKGTKNPHNSQPEKCVEEGVMNSVRTWKAKGIQDDKC